MKKTLCILALAGSAIALTTAIIHANRKNKSNEEFGSHDSNYAEVKGEKDDSDVVQDLDAQRKKASSTISERHWEAEQIVREAMTDMQEYKQGNSKHKKEFDEIDNNINILLDEEQ